MTEQQAAQPQGSQPQAQKPEISLEELMNAPVGDLAMTLEWRLAGCCLPLASRHLATLDARGFAHGLQSWCRQHIEWTLLEGAQDHPDGVLVIEVDTYGRAVMSVIAHEPDPAPADCTKAALFERAHVVAIADDDPLCAEALWLSDAPDHLICAVDPGQRLSGANDLVAQLAQTKGVAVTRVNLADKDEAQVLASQLERMTDVFLVSDKRGVICASDATGAQGTAMHEHYAKLLQITALKNKRLG